MPILPIAVVVQGNDKVWDYFETHEQSPDSSGFHRYRIVYVARDGKIAEFRQDMGLASNFKGIQQIHIPSLFEHSMDELLDMADELRNKKEIDLHDWLEIDNFKTA